MPDKTHDQSRRLDDEFAAFTDRLLSGELSGSKEMSTQDQELRELQETARRLHRSFESARPDSAVAERIHDNLVAEWREAGLGTQSDSSRRGWLRGSVSTRRQRPVYALAMAAAIVLLGILATFLIPATPAASLTGAAGADGKGLWLIFALGIVVVGIVWWSIRRKR